MSSKTVFCREVDVSSTEKTTVRFNSEFEFVVVPEILDEKNLIFNLQDIKGDFEVTKIVHHYEKEKNLYDSKTNSFKSYFFKIDTTKFYFYIMPNVVFKEVNYVAVEYKLNISWLCIKNIKHYESHSFAIELPGYEYLKFNGFVKRFSNNSFTLVIENPYDVQINHQKGDYVNEIFTHKIDLNLIFIFDHLAVHIAVHAPLAVESRPDSVISPKFEKVFASKLSLHDILSESNYTDFIFISSDNHRLATYKSVIAKHSKKLAKCFESDSKNPAEIIIDKYEAKTIAAALDFYHGKAGSFKAQEFLMPNILKFAYDYEFDELKESCHAYYEEIINTKNVCEILQMAYQYNFESLKEKCKIFMNENKTEIKQDMLENLPKNILIDVFCR